MDAESLTLLAGAKMQNNGNMNCSLHTRKRSLHPRSFLPNPNPVPRRLAEASDSFIQTMNNACSSSYEIVDHIRPG